MMKKSILLLFLSCCSLLLLAQDSSREKYINKYKKTAMDEMERSGVPASIKLAQGILESNAGKSTLARKANNHFGMKCGSQWTGKEYYLEDDDYDEDGRLIKSCFRVFRNAKASYIAHSEFLRDERKSYRYGFLFNLDPRDYKAWSRGLKKAGYATSPTYAEKLIRIIETYSLYRYDNVGYEDPREEEEKEKEEKEVVIIDEDERIEDGSGIQVINNVKSILAEAGDTPLDIGLRNELSAKCLLKYNVQLTSPTQTIAENTRIFIQRKRCGYRGKKKWHIVREGETLFSLSQRYAIRLDRLHKRNRIEKGREPKVGELVKIRGWKVRKKKAPKTRKVEEEEEIERMENGEIEAEDPIDDEVEFVEETDALIDEEESFDPFDEQLPDDPPLYHRVEKGETLYKLSRFYGVSVQQIRLLNDLDSNIISVGQTLRIK